MNVTENRMNIKRRKRRGCCNGEKFEEKQRAESREGELSARGRTKTKKKKGGPPLEAEEKAGIGEAKA